MPRVILQYPFMKHYAGSVFDLEINNRRASWDIDERLYDRMPSEKSYFLPDGGKGFALDLPVSDTVLCPPSVFEGIDLSTGPCRITSAQTKSSADSKIPNEKQLKIETTQLFDIDDNNHGILIQLPEQSPEPQKTVIFNRTTNEILNDIKSADYALSLDFKSFMPGFYEIKIECKNDLIHIITFIKCFPLVVTYDAPRGTYTAMKTIY